MTESFWNSPLTGESATVASPSLPDRLDRKPGLPCHRRGAAQSQQSNLIQQPNSFVFRDSKSTRRGSATGVGKSPAVLK